MRLLSRTFFLLSMLFYPAHHIPAATPQIPLRFILDRLNAYPPGLKADAAQAKWEAETGTRCKATEKPGAWTCEAGKLPAGIVRHWLSIAGAPPVTEIHFELAPGAFEGAEALVKALPGYDAKMESKYVGRNARAWGVGSYRVMLLSGAYELIVTPEGKLVRLTRIDAGKPLPPKPPVPFERGGFDASMKFIARLLADYPSTMSPGKAVTVWQEETGRPCAPQGSLIDCSGLKPPFTEIMNAELLADMELSRVRMRILLAPFFAKKEDIEKIAKSLPETLKNPAKCRMRASGTSCRIPIPCGEYIVDFDGEGRASALERSCSR